MTLEMNRIAGITEFYLSRFGKAQTGIFDLPLAASTFVRFQTFTNTLMVTLRRRDLMPYHFWHRDANRLLLFLWTNGYFRTDLRDVVPVLERIWAFHSPAPVTILGNFSLSAESPAETTRFLQTAEAWLQVADHAGGAWHQRTFGGFLTR